MLGLHHFLLGKRDPVTHVPPPRPPAPYTVLSLRYWDPSPISLSFVTFQSSPLFASCIIPRGAGEDVST